MENRVQLYHPDGSLKISIDRDESDLACQILYYRKPPISNIEFRRYRIGNVLFEEHYDIDGFPDVFGKHNIINVTPFNIHTGIGERMKFYPKSDHKKQSFTCLDLKADGPSTHFYPQSGGKSMDTSISDGKYHGETISYYLNGIIRSKYTYFKGVIEGIYSNYDRDGKLASTYNYLNGLKDGQAVLYDSKGVINRILNYRRGRREGSCIYFNRHGEVESYEVFFEDRSEGVFEISKKRKRN